MKKLLFKELNLKDKEAIISFIERNALRCNTVYYDTQRCYSANQRRVEVFNFLMQSDNFMLLGKDDSFYKRYRSLRSEFRKAFNMEKECAFTNVCSGLIVVPSGVRTPGRPIKAINDIPLGVNLEKISESSEDWLKRIKQKYEAEYALRTKEGYIIGPEEALILSVKEALRTTGKKRLLDLGAGTGEVSAYALRRFKGLEVFVNEASPHLTEDLSNYLLSVAIKTGNKLKMLSGDAKQILIPDVDIICAGIFYGELPELIKQKGEEIARKLKDGVFVLQSGMLENLFALLVIDPTILPDIKIWPWYDERMNLRNFFKEVNHIYLCGEIITLASQNNSTNQKIIKNLEDKITQFKL